jgi:hypothetical protein
MYTFRIHDVPNMASNSLNFKESAKKYVNDIMEQFPNDIHIFIFNTTNKQDNISFYNKNVYSITTPSGSECDDKSVIFLSLILRNYFKILREYLIIHTNDDYDRPQHGDLISIYQQTLIDYKNKYKLDYYTNNSSFDNLVTKSTKINSSGFHSSPNTNKKRLERFSKPKILFEELKDENDKNDENESPNIKKTRYQNKYLKYKMKYLNLLKIINNYD